MHSSGLPSISSTSCNHSWREDKAHSCRPSTLPCLCDLELRQRRHQAKHKLCLLWNKTISFPSSLPLRNESSLLSQAAVWAWHVWRIATHFHTNEPTRHDYFHHIQTKRDQTHLETSLLIRQVLCLYLFWFFSNWSGWSMHCSYFFKRNIFWIFPGSLGTIDVGGVQ